MFVKSLENVVLIWMVICAQSWEMWKCQHTCDRRTLLTPEDAWRAPPAPEGVWGVAAEGRSLIELIGS